MNTLRSNFKQYPYIFCIYSILNFCYSKLWLQKSFKYIMLAYLITPLHGFILMSCIFTLFTKNGNDFQHTETESTFQKNI